MIPGLDRYREHFHGFESSYVLIGGAAAHLLLDEAGLQFRATKDLDIVLCDVHHLLARLPPAPQHRAASTSNVAITSSVVSPGRSSCCAYGARATCRGTPGSSSTARCSPNWVSPWGAVRGQRPIPGLLLALGRQLHGQGLNFPIHKALPNCSTHGI